MSEHGTDFERYVDFKKMYLRMMGAAEEAMNLLIEAQRECEELYVSAVEQRQADLGLDLSTDPADLPEELRVLLHDGQ